MKVTRTISSYVLLVGVMGLSIVGGVVVYQIYSAATKTQITTEQKTTIKPLDGVINQTTIDNLNKRTVYTDAQMGVLLSATPTPSPTPEVTGVVLTPTPTITGVIITPTPESTNSGTTQ